MLGVFSFTLCIEWSTVKCSGYKNIKEYENFIRKKDKISKKKKKEKKKKILVQIKGNK